MKSLTIFYDQRCGFCRKCREWLEQQPTYLKLEFVSCHARDLEERFPGIGAFRPGEQLVAVDDAGRVYVEEHAWLLCLFALKAYRPWARRLASPILRPLARQLFLQISGNRGALSCLVERESPSPASSRAPGDPL